MSRVDVTISGEVGSGKSAIYMEIYVALQALGVPVEHANPAAFQCEVNSGFGDSHGALELYKPTVKMAEINHNQMLNYEHRILSAECGTQRILNQLRAKVKWAAEQARTNRDAFDPQAAAILDNVAGWIDEIDVTDHSATKGAGH